MGKELNKIYCFPEPLIEDIIFLLPSKDVVRTCALAKRWKDKWMSHPHISFSDDYITSPIALTARFVEIVDFLLSHRHGEARIKKFQLSCKEGMEDSMFARWFGIFMKDDLEELELNISRLNDKPMKYLVECKSLVKLKLHFGYFSTDSFPKSVNFPNLKSLHLSNFVLPLNFLSQLVKFRKLESLCMNRFTFELAFPFGDAFAITNGYLTGDIGQDILPNLKHVVLLHCPNTFIGRYFLKVLLTVISNAKVMEFKASITEFLMVEPTFPNQLPAFNNLTHLKICIDVHSVRVLNYMFQKAANLRSLHVEFDMPGHYKNYDELLLGQLRSNCTPVCLNVIRLTDFSPEDLQLEFLRLLFGTVGSLNKIVIELHEVASCDPFEQCEKLLQLPRLSKNCVLSVKWKDGNHTFNLFE